MLGFKYLLFSIFGCKTEITGCEIPTVQASSFKGINNYSMAKISLSETGTFKGSLALEGADNITYGLYVPHYVIPPEFDETMPPKDMKSKIASLDSRALDVQLHVVVAAGHLDWHLSASYLNDA